MTAPTLEQRNKATGAMLAANPKLTNLEIDALIDRDGWHALTPEQLALVPDGMSLDGKAEADIALALIRDAVLAQAREARKTPAATDTTEPQWMTAAAWYAEQHAETEWICAPYIAAGDLVEIDGKPKRAGKSTFIAAMTRQITLGQPFLGGKTKAGDVVWLTEMDGTSLRECLETAELQGNARLHIITYTEMRGKTWAQTVEIALAKCREVGAVLLVVDVIARWAHVVADTGNSSGTWTEALDPLFAFKGIGCAVALLHWERKSGGPVGESGAGYASLTGSVDVVLKLSRIDGGENSRHRRLEATGRHSDTPEDVVIDLEDGGGYTLVGAGAAAVRDNTRELILSVMRNRKEWTEAQLILATGKPRSTVQRALEWSKDAGEIVKTLGSQGGARGTNAATFRRQYVSGEDFKAWASEHGI